MTQLSTERMKGFFEGMQHAAKIASSTGRGEVSGRAIKREITILTLCNERYKNKKPFSKPQIEDYKDALQ